MASTIGTARGRTHGSCRTRPFSEVFFKFTSTVCCSCMTVAGFEGHPKINRRAVGYARLECRRNDWSASVAALPPLLRKASLCCCNPAQQHVSGKPGADFKTLIEAGTGLNIPLPKSASSRSKTGSPQPGRTPSRHAFRPTRPRAVPRPPHFFDLPDHPLRRVLVRATHDFGFDVLLFDSSAAITPCPPCASIFCTLWT